jgi:predicted transcriptional regulator
MSTKKHLDTLLELKENPSLSQRSLAHKLNISLGLTNSILKNLISRGLLKVKKDTGRKLLYIITPKGMANVSRLMYNRFQETLHYYHYTKDLLTTYLMKLYQQGEKRINIYGTGQLAEITYYAGIDTPLKLNAIISGDPSLSKKKFLGHEILTLSEFVQKISKTPAPENLIILSTVSQEKDEKGKDKTQSLKTEIKKYKNLPKNLQIINLEAILKNVKD